MTAFRTSRPPTSDARVSRALADAEPVPFWLDGPGAPPRRPALTGESTCDLAIVGGGFTGLWTALLAKEHDPAADVVILEADRIGGQASGRNGGFCMASLTHGLATGADLFPGEISQLQRLGQENLDAIEAALPRYGIDCDWQRTGELEVATAPWHVAGMREMSELYERFGEPAEWFDREAIRSEVASPTYLAGLWHKDGALVDPAKLAWGLARACAVTGVRSYERTPVTALRRAGAGVQLVTPWGTMRARRVVLATNGFRPLLGRLRLRIVPVYDYALVTEPLTPDQRASIGWQRRQGLSDAGNMFHYYRLTADDRILWGGWDALYYYGSRVDPALEQRPRTFALLAEHFFATFPQLEGLRFTHRWGGVIDTCSRFFAFYGTAWEGRVAYALGFTGAGVGPTRFAAEVVLDLLSGRSTERTQLETVRSRPLPFPPEPLRSGVIQATRWSTERAERAGGRRNLWLRALDRFGLGFDS